MAGRVHVYLSVFDQGDSNVGFNHVVQQFDLSDEQMRDIATSSDSNFRYTMKVDLKPGAYKVSCPIAGHEEHGMKMDLSVK